MPPDRIELFVAGVTVGTVGETAAARWMQVLAVLGQVEMIDQAGEVIRHKEK